MFQKKRKIEELQSLRAIAFFEIFLGHCGILFFTGAFGVSIFIVLSGFCMAINYLPRIGDLALSLGTNVRNAFSKVKKLYGLHLFMLICAFFLAKMPSSVTAVKRLLMDVLLVQSWSPYAEDYFSYNGVAWYLSVYLFLSIAAPYILKFLRGFKERQQVLLLMTAVFFAMVIIGTFVSFRQISVGNDFAFWLTYISPPYRSLEFFLGAALGWFYLRAEKVRINNKILETAAEGFAVMAFVGIICVFHKIEGHYDGLCYTALFTPVSMLLVLVFVYSRGLVMKILHNKVFLWLGNLSSCTFLIHQVVIRWLVTILNREQWGNLYIFALTILSFAITVIGAELALFIIKKSGGSHGKRISGICNF